MTRVLSSPAVKCLDTCCFLLYTHFMKRHYTRNLKLAKRDIEMINLRREGLTYEEIGKMFNISRQRVHQIIDKLITL